MIKYLLLLLLLTTPKTRAADYSILDSIHIPKIIVYSVDSTGMEKPKVRSRSEVISIISVITGTVLTIIGVASGSIQAIIYGSIFIIIALFTAKRKRKNRSEKIPQQMPSDYTGKGLALPGRAVALVLLTLIGGVLAVWGLTYLMLSKGI